MRVFVIGGSGLVGTNVVEHCVERGFEVRGTYKTDPSATADQQLDKTSLADVTEALERFDPDAVVDTAAFHAVDDCETERELAWDVNASGTRNAAVASDRVGAQYVYLSTDYVFPGRPSEAPYVESDPVSPCNYYAQTKYVGEQAARIADCATVLRPSVVYGLAGDCFLTWALGELEDGTQVDIVDDQVSRPTYAPDLARATVELVARGETGLFHATGPESVSRYEFTVALAEVCGYDPALVSPVTTEQLGQMAPRPADSSLDSTPLYETVDRTFRPPQEAFSAVAEQL